MPLSAELMQNTLNLLPTPGKQPRSRCWWPRRAGWIHLYSGYSVPPHYDSLIAKLIVHGDDRAHCLARLRRALEEFVVEPIPTTLTLHKRLVDASAITDGSYNIRWLEEVFLNNQ